MQNLGVQDGVVGGCENGELGPRLRSGLKKIGKSPPNANRIKKEERGRSVGSYGSWGRESQRSRYLNSEWVSCWVRANLQV